MKILVCFLAILIAISVFGCKILMPLPSIGDEYRLEYDPMTDVALVDSNDNYFIDGHILEYGVDSTFVVVAQRPKDRFPECTGEMPGSTPDDCEKVFKKSTFRQYWILNKKEKPEVTDRPGVYSNVYGPYTKAEYIQAREKLGVPKGLQLKPLKH